MTLYQAIAGRCRVECAKCKVIAQTFLRLQQNLTFSALLKETLQVWRTGRLMFRYEPTKGKSKTAATTIDVIVAADNLLWGGCEMVLLHQHLTYRTVTHT